MKLAPQQHAFIKKLLANVVLYQETFDEVYDHVVTALEQKPQLLNLHQEVYAVIHDDFGGYANISRMEKCRHDLIRNDLNTQYKQYLKQYLQNPLVVIPMLAIIALLYFACTIFKVNFMISLAAALLISAMPQGYVFVQKYFIGVNGNRHKNSVLSDVAVGNKIRGSFFLAILLIYVGFLISSGFFNGKLYVDNPFITGFCTMFFIMVLCNSFLFWRVYVTRFSQDAHQWN